jgi:hypothetical protein
VSVDTYLKGKNLQRYRTVLDEDVKVLVAPDLYAQARTIRLELSDFILWKSLRAEVEPIGDHFHSPACRH